jgi:hypothetical protein
MKNYRVSARVSERAYKDLTIVSERMNISKSEIIERLIRCQNLVVINGLDKFLPALKLAERNLNQVAARLSMGHNLLIDVNEIRNIYNKILELLKQIKRGEIDNGNH